MTFRLRLSSIAVATGSEDEVKICALKQSRWDEIPTNEMLFVRFNLGIVSNVLAAVKTMLV
jgi:hypothetical protein